MREVGVAFPNDEATAQLIASRKRAHEILGTQPRPAETPQPMLQFGIVFVIIALAIGAAMIVVLLSRLG